MSPPFFGPRLGRRGAGADRRRARTRPPSSNRRPRPSSRAPADGRAGKLRGARRRACAVRQSVSRRVQTRSPEPRRSLKPSADASRRSQKNPRPRISFPGDRRRRTRAAPATLVEQAPVTEAPAAVEQAAPPPPGSAAATGVNARPAPTAAPDYRLRAVAKSSRLPLRRRPARCRPRFGPPWSGWRRAGRPRRAGQTPAAALRREREAIAAFYEARAFAPLWIAGETFTSGGPLRACSHRSRPRGRARPLPISRRAPLGRRFARGDGAGRIALSQAVVGYARQASGARVDPRAIGLITARPEVAGVAEALEKVSGAADAGRGARRLQPAPSGLSGAAREARRVAPRASCRRQPAHCARPGAARRHEGPARAAGARALWHRRERGRQWRRTRLRHARRERRRRFPARAWTSRQRRAHAAHHHPPVRRRPLAAGRRDHREHGAVALGAARHGRRRASR